MLKIRNDDIFYMPHIKTTEWENLIGYMHKQIQKGFAIPFNDFEPKISTYTTNAIIEQQLVKFLTPIQVICLKSL